IKRKLGSTDIELVKKDVLPFLKNKSELDIWSNDYFIQLADMLIIK
ncbi:MAG: nucleotidyl transferase AbiEii/AbiGii toxin family protein, partial [Bacteroidales bacterium]